MYINLNFSAFCYKVMRNSFHKICFINPFHVHMRKCILIFWNNFMDKLSLHYAQSKIICEIRKLPNSSKLK